MSAKAGLEIRTPVVIPISVVTAKPFRSPAEAAPIPMNPRKPVNGIIATNVVVKAVTIMKSAFFTLCIIDSNLSRASSNMISCESIPVPMAAMIPAIEGRSRFQPISEATPRMISTSDRETVTRAMETFILLYLTNTTIETAMIANNPAMRICFVNWSPRFGDILSSFSICSLNGSDPVIKIVWSFFISNSAASMASALVVPEPEPEIEICVATVPFNDVPILREDVGFPSIKKSNFLLRYEPLIVSVSVMSACLCAAASLKNMVNLKLHASPLSAAKHSVISASCPVLPT